MESINNLGLTDGKQNERKVMREGGAEKVVAFQMRASSSRYTFGANVRKGSPS